MQGHRDARQEWKLEKQKQAGADHVVLEEGLSEQVKKIAPNGVDTIVSCL